ncbi:hypothetical protein [Bradyrhizobium diazoefficiens]
MTKHVPEDIRSALGLAEQILQELPDELRPNMRALLTGEASVHDGLIIAEAIATALAITNPPYRDGDDRDLRADAYNARMSEFATLFELVMRRCSPLGFPHHLYLQACFLAGMAQAMRPTIN